MNISAGSEYQGSTCVMFKIKRLKKALIYITVESYDREGTSRVGEAFFEAVIGETGDYRK